MYSRPNLVLALIILVYVAIATLYAFSVPAWNTPDEPAHYNYVRQIAEQRTLPVLEVGDYDAALLERLKSARFPPGEPVDAIRYEGWQPPLFYLLATPVYWSTSSLTTSHRVIGLRLVSVLFGALLLLVAYATVRLIIGAWSGIVAAGFIAFVPMWVFISASINNDALAVLVLSTILLMLVRMFTRSEEGLGLGRSQNMDVGLIGVLLGITFITKSTTYIAAPLIAVAFLWPSPGEKWISAALSGRLKRLLRVYGIAAALGGWWFIRNAWVYGNFDVMGRSRHDQVVAGQPIAGNMSLEMLQTLVTTVFRSFWAQFGWMGVMVDQRIYHLLALISMITVAGLIVWTIKLRGEGASIHQARYRALTLLLGSATLTTAALIFYNLTFIQAQGRYLFPALVPISAFFVISWSSLLSARLRSIGAVMWIIALAGLDVVCLYRFILPDLRP
jgi:4-amino-4-deoxy-L-arabinose transferase-like glycosyltransferase